MARNGNDGLVNHTIQHLVEGVSEQINEARRETQVEEMINCIPHVSRGVMRRNPVDFVGDLRDKDNNILTPEDFFVYTYDRGTEGEQYMILIGNRKWYSFNVNTGALVGQYNDVDNIGTSLDYLDTKGKLPKEVFSLVTVGDYTWINNSEIVTSMVDDLPRDINGEVIDATNDHLKNAIIWIKKTDNRITKQDPNTGDNTVVGLSYYASCGNASARILGGNQQPVLAPYAQLAYTYQVAGEMALTLNDSGSISDTRVESRIKRFKQIYDRDDRFFKVYRNSQFEGEYFVLEKVNKTTGQKSYKYVWDGEIVNNDSGTIYEIENFTNDYKYLTETESYYWKYYFIQRITFKVDENIILSANGQKANWKSTGDFIYNTNEFLPADLQLTVQDGASGSAMLGIKGLVNSAADLPAQLPKSIGNVLVKVDSSKTEDTGEEHWLLWNGEYWKESMRHGLINSIDETTMPHVFTRNESGNIEFGYYGEKTHNSSQWKSRTVGDLDTAPDPSFINKKISSIFFHNNRFGILSEDNIVMSELSIYGNFFPTTIRTIPETDPIDITAATRDVTTLKSAASVSGSLLLFSETSQFILTSTGGALTPESAVINNVSSYNYNPLAPANVIGNKIFFSSESGNGTQMFDFELSSVLTTGSENVAANNRSLHIPTYLPTGMNNIIGHSILGYVFMQSPNDSKSVYILNTITVDGQGAQSAFHKWTFDYDIVGINIVKNSLNILFKNNADNKLSITNISLDIPSDISTVDYTDDFDGNRTNLYESSIRLSKWQIKDANGLGTPRGRLQIRTAQIAASNNSQYTIKLVNEELFSTASNWILADGAWEDTGVWNDTKVWTDGFPYKERIYDNDKRVSVLSHAEKTFMIFQSHRTNKNKGFELATINLEGMFRQRSTRY